MSIENIRALLEELTNEVNKLDPAIPSPYPSTHPKDMRPTRAYDSARALWEAAQRGDIEGETFSIHAFVGQGIRPFAQQFTEPKPLDEEALCIEVERIGKSPGGRKWLAVDENAAMLGWNWQMFFNGYVVRRASMNPDDGFVRR